MNTPRQFAMCFQCGITIAIALCAPAAYCQRGSQSYVAQVNQGKEALRERQWRSAESHFRTALQWDSRGVEAHLGLGEAYLAIGEVQRAQEQFSAALHLKPHSAEAERGIHQARSEGEEERAFQALKEQVKSEPGNADVLATYAEELIERNQIELARNEATLAIKIDPRQGHAYCALGRIAFKEGKAEEAKTLLDKAVRFDNTDDDALALLGDLAMRRKDYLKAVSFYRRVVSVVPDELEGHRKLIEALTMSGDARAAAREKQTLTHLSSPPK